MSQYQKTLKDGFEQDFYTSLGFPPLSDDSGIELVIRITIEDMNLLDGFYMNLPIDAEFLSIEQTIEKYIICRTPEERLELKRKFSKYKNPDLVDFFDILTDIYMQYDSGDTIIQYHINNGESNINPKEPLYLHEQNQVENNQGYKLVDLVLEIQHNIDPFYLITEPQKESLFAEFRQVFILYMVEKYNYLLNSDLLMPESKCQISKIIDELLFEGLIQKPDEDRQNLSVSHNGNEFLRGIVVEAEYYIDNYDIFGDVYIKNDSISFDTGYGDNLIPTVLLHDGIDPYRAIFLSALYIGNLDEIASDLSKLFSDEIFKFLFESIGNSPMEDNLGSELLSQIITKGKETLYERQLSEEKAEYIERINRRINQI
jgi:hypothetical protein